MSLQELSHILATTGISTSQEEHILTPFKNLVGSPQEDVEVPSDSYCQFVEVAQESWIEFNWEKPLEPEIEEFLACLSTDPVCTPKTNNLEEDNLRSMEKEDMMCDLNKEEKREYLDPIERWFQLVVRSHYSFTFHYCLISSSNQLVLHTSVCIKIYLLNPSMDIFLTLLCTWLHWKYSYTWRTFSLVQLE
jgi:hypothetical protein